MSRTRIIKSNEYFKIFANIATNDKIKSSELRDLLRTQNKSEYGVNKLRDQLQKLQNYNMKKGIKGGFIQHDKINGGRYGRAGKYYVNWDFITALFFEKYYPVNMTLILKSHDVRTLEDKKHLVRRFVMRVINMHLGKMKPEGIKSIGKTGLSFKRRYQPEIDQEARKIKNLDQMFNLVVQHIAFLFFTQSNLRSLIIRMSEWEDNHK